MSNADYTSFYDYDRPQNILGGETLEDYYECVRVLFHFVCVFVVLFARHSYYPIVGGQNGSVPVPGGSFTEVRAPWNFFTGMANYLTNEIESSCCLGSFGFNADVWFLVRRLRSSDWGLDTFVLI